MVIIGAFHEMIELLEENNEIILGCVDKSYKRGSLFFNHPILGNDHEFLNNKSDYMNTELLITPDKTKYRESLVKLYSRENFAFHSLISKKAKVSKSSYIDVGTIIQYGVNISSNCRIGKFNKLNTYSNIMHDVITDDFVTIAPNAAILGNVKIGRHCYIGSNATILPGISICDNVIIGAGCVVTKDITSEGKYIGVPVKKM